MRRLIDFTVGAFALVLLFPLIALLALIVLCCLGRPILFRQTRAGRWGADFFILKFRTMRAPSYFGEPDDARLNTAGRVLRGTSLDELPQLVNVLRGEMALVGPRPTLPEQIDYYDARQRGRLSVRPGVTGWAQIHGRNSRSWPERIELDLWYVEHRSVLLDLRIILRTAVALLRPRGVVAGPDANPFRPDAPTQPIRGIPPVSTQRENLRPESSATEECDVPATDKNLI